MENRGLRWGGRVFFAGCIDGSNPAVVWLRSLEQCPTKLNPMGWDCFVTYVGESYPNTPGDCVVC
jgi:hypothetical protein